MRLRILNFTIWTCLLLSAVPTLAQTATTTPAAQAATGSGEVTAPLGIPSNIWVTLILGAGGYAVIGKGLGSMFNSGVSFVQALSENAPRRWQSELERDGVETLNLKQEAEFLAEMNKALKQQGETILMLQQADAAKSSIITGMQANGLEQAKLITNMQIASFERDRSHREELARQEARITTMEQAEVQREADLSQAQADAAHWKEKYNLEHARAERLAQELSEKEVELQRLRAALPSSDFEINQPGE